MDTPAPDHTRQSAALTKLLPAHSAQMWLKDGNLPEARPRSPQAIRGARVGPLPSLLSAARRVGKQTLKTVHTLATTLQMVSCPERLSRSPRNQTPCQENNTDCVNTFKSKPDRPPRSLTPTPELPLPVPPVRNGGGCEPATLQAT